LLLDHSDSEEFATALFRLLQNEKERQEFGSRAREFTLDNYNSRKAADSYLEGVFYQVIEE
jgi:glycosyltransferase involved in cell wall biosynthesis